MASHGFDLELAKVIRDVSVLPSLVSPLQEVVVPPCANAADYAAPAAPALETVLQLPGYMVPEELGCSWMLEFVPVSEVVSADEGATCDRYRNRFRRRQAHPLSPRWWQISPHRRCR